MANGPGLTLRLDPQLHKDLKRLAEKEDRSLSNLVRVALNRYVEDEAIRDEREVGK